VVILPQLTGGAQRGSGEPPTADVRHAGQLRTPRRRFGTPSRLLELNDLATNLKGPVQPSSYQEMTADGPTGCGDTRPLPRARDRISLPGLPPLLQLQQLQARC
jgi:hypothetical protein